MNLHEIKLTRIQGVKQSPYWFFPFQCTSIEPFEGGSYINFEKDHCVYVSETPEMIFKIMKESRRLI